MIKNVIFDLGGVLLDIDLIYCMRNVQALGVDLDALSKQDMGTKTPSDSTHNAVMGEGIVATGAINLYQVGAITTQQFISGIQRLCHPGTTYQQVLDAWNTCCIGIPPHRLDKIRELRQHGYRISLLSNTNDAHWQDIVNRCFGGQVAVDNLFDHVFLSQEMHIAKPNDRIFLAVLNTLGAKPDECLFIDDSTPNVAAAAALGFHTIHADVSKTHDGKVVAPPETEWKDAIDTLLAHRP